MTARAAVAFAATLLLAGCTSTVAGSPAAGQAPPSSRPSAPPLTRPSTTTTSRPAQVTAKDALGDLTTVEACSLTDTSVFSTFGSAALGVPDGFDSCTVEVTVGADQKVEVYLGDLDAVGQVADLPSKKSVSLPGGLTVVDYISDPDYCEKLLIFPDGIALSVTAEAFDGAPPTLCDTASAAVDKVVAVVRAGKVGHHSYPARSLSGLDPCELMPAGAIAAVPGLGSAKPRAYPAQHSCLWRAGDASTNPTVRVVFAPGTAPDATQPGVTQSAIGGRPTVLTPTPEAGANAYCGADTAGAAYQLSGYSGPLVEVATVYVRMQSGQVDAACQAATALATALWPKLPAA
jgi:hypothetical protein